VKDGNAGVCVTYLRDLPTPTPPPTLPITCSLGEDGARTEGDSGSAGADGADLGKGGAGVLLAGMCDSCGKQKSGPLPRPHGPHHIVLGRQPC
jgi:hypothetical protein